MTTLTIQNLFSPPAGLGLLVVIEETCLFESVSGGLVDQLESIRTEECPAVPPRHDH